MATTILILLVEDQILIADDMRTALEDGGYDVVISHDGSSAIQTLERRFADLAGLATDIQLGAGPTGWEVGRRARELKPELPVIYMTADSASEWAAQGVPKSLLLEKPFASAQLVTAISTALNEASSRPGS